MTRAVRTCVVRGIVAVLNAAAMACGGGSPAGPTSPPANPRWTLQVRVQTEQQAPVAGAAVRIVDGPDAGRSATTDAAGQAVLADLQQAGFTIEATAAGYLAARSAVTLTSSMTLAVTLRPRPPNVPPVIVSLVARGTRVNQPVGFADAGETVSVTATVTDAETPADQLSFEWSADGGALSGSGPVVSWTAPTGAGTPKVYTLTLTVVEKVSDSVRASAVLEPAALGSLPPRGTGANASADNRVSATTTVRVHESVKEIGDLAFGFLTEFSNSSIPAETVIRNFSTTCDGGRGRAAELEDVASNRRDLVINSYRLGDPAVAIGFAQGCAFRDRPGDACVSIACEWNSTRLSTGLPERAWGTCRLSASYDVDRWALCWSDFDGQTSTGLRFMR